MSDAKQQRRERADYRKMPDELMREAVYQTNSGFDGRARTCLELARGAQDALDKIEHLERERDSARADLAEALKALRELYEAHDIDERDLEPYKRQAIIDDATVRARAILSKHAKPEGGAT